MSRNLLSCLGLALPLCLASATRAQPLPLEESQRDFAAANERALEGDGAGATGLYQSLLDRGAEHPAILYNLGTVLAQRGEDVAAAIALERTLKLDPGHEDARINLAVLRDRAPGRPSLSVPNDAGSVAFADVLEPVVANTPPGETAWAGAAAWALLFLFLAARRLTRRPTGRRGLLALAVATGLAALTLGAIAAAHAYVAAEPLAVALRPLELRNGPDQRFEPSGSVAPGARLRILERDPAWVEVLTADGVSGWAPTQDVAPLEPLAPRS